MEKMTADAALAAGQAPTPGPDRDEAVVREAFADIWLADADATANVKAEAERAFDRIIAQRGEALDWATAAEERAAAAEAEVAERDEAFATLNARLDEAEAAEAEVERLRTAIRDHEKWHGSFGHDGLRAALLQTKEE